jgi:hypothetical protein
MKEYDLVEYRRTLEDMLLELPAPRLRRNICKDRIEVEIPPLVLEARRGV